MRYNGKFNYTELAEAPERNKSTGFYESPAESSVWLPGGLCQLEKSIPAKQMIVEDGQMFSYTYDMFIPKHVFRGVLEIGAKIQFTSEDGVEAEFTILGIDDLNGRYIEVWG